MAFCNLITYVTALNFTCAYITYIWCMDRVALIWKNVVNSQSHSLEICKRTKKYEIQSFRQIEENLEVAHNDWNSENYWFFPFLWSTICWLITYIYTKFFEQSNFLTLLESVQVKLIMHWALSDLYSKDGVFVFTSKTKDFIWK